MRVFDPFPFFFAHGLQSSIAFSRLMRRLTQQRVVLITDDTPVSTSDMWYAEDRLVSFKSHPDPCP